jgi:HK97 family phage prohead protease
MIEGWASVYDIDDDHGDKVQAGAFRDTFLRRPRIAMLRNHEKGLLMGRWDSHYEATIDGVTGLFVRGVVFDELACAQILRGDLFGLSIGYRCLEHREDEDFRYLTKVELMEVSLVDVPCNPLCLITSAMQVGGK